MLYTLRFSLHNAVCFIMLICLVLVLFTFYIQGVLKLNKLIPAKRVNVFTTARYTNAAACAELIVRAQHRRSCCFK